MSWLAKRICRRKGHEWLLSHAAKYISDQPGSEFIPVHDICLRCGEKTVTLPWGECMGEHPLAEHYDAEGGLVEHPSCPGPA